MDKMLFIKAIPRIRVYEKRLLDRAKLDRMLDSGSMEEALKVLSETEYSSLVSGLKKVQDYEIVLSGELQRVISLLYEITPEKLLVDILTLKYDYHNIRVLLKAKALDKELDELLLSAGNISPDRLKSCIRDEDLRELEPVMREAVEKTWEAFKVSEDPQTIDISLDRFMFRDMLQKAEKLGEQFLIDYTKMSIDLINIKTLFRVKKQNKDREFIRQVIIEGGNLKGDIFINNFNDSMDSFANKISHTNYYNILKLGLEEYNKTGRINIFEKLSENMLMEYMKKAKYVSFGAEPLIAYFAAKEAEIKAVRIILVGKLNKVSPELIRERLRDIYV